MGLNFFSLEDGYTRADFVARHQVASLCLIAISRIDDGLSRDGAAIHARSDRLTQVMARCTFFCLSSRERRCALDL